jgi:rubrerythrin
MCGPESQMILEIDEVPWRTFLCRVCGKTFRMMSKRPHCPQCQSEHLTIL